MLEPLRFAGAADGERRALEAAGRFEPGASDWAYLPVGVPPGVGELAISYRYDRPEPPQGMAGNALDLGVFDPRGHGPGGPGFRGWSGGARDRFAIGPSGATPGYLPGPVQPGTWHLLLGPYTVAPQGMAWAVRVELRYGPSGAPFVPAAAPARAGGRGRAWYRGDAHVHSVHSDGWRLPEEVVAAARSAGLDFVVSTEHNTSSASGIWGRHASGAGPLVVDGEEVTTRNGHLLALGLPAGEWIDWRYRAGDPAFGRALARIHELGALAVAAHPYCPFPGCAWRFGYAGVDAVEVWNGPWTLDDEAALATWDGLLPAAAAAPGRWPVALGGSDAHREPEPIGLPRNVVLAAGLERRAILDGIRAGHLWIAESPGVELSLEAAAGGRPAGIGERLGAEPGTPVTVRLEAAGVAGCVARLATDLGAVVDAPAGPDGRLALSWTTTPRASAYVRAELRRPGPAPTPAGTMVALTNPVFLGPAGPGPAGLGPR